MRRNLTAVALLFAPVALSAQTPPSPATVARLTDSLARAFIAQRGSPSVAIGITRGGTPVVIGSVTKQFTSAAVMQLVEQNKVRLGDSIATYLSSLPAAWRGVTVKQLLNHTSGIPSYTSSSAWMGRWGEEMKPDTLLAFTASMPMKFSPGTRWEYNNTGYVLLGMLIEKVAGRTWADDMEARFFKPLGLSDTRNCMTSPVVLRRVHGYEPDGTGWRNSAFLAMTQPYAAGALCSTIGDLSRWNRALHTGNVVSAQSYALMTTAEGAAAARNYGFGLGRDTVGGQPIVSHNGGINGFITENVWVPNGEVSVSVLTNSGAAPAGRLRRQVMLATLGLPLEYPPKVAALTAADRARYSGVYLLAFPGGLREFTVAEQGTELTGMMAGQQPNPLLHYGNHTFGASFDPTVRISFTVEQGRATKMILMQGANRTEGARK